MLAAGPVSRILSAPASRNWTAIPLGRALLRGSSDLPEGLTHRAGTSPAEAGVPPYLVLLRVGFALPAALLSRRCALTAPFHPYPGVAAGAVCFLWHFPSSGLESTLPDVIRHTALRSSDFPLLAPESAKSDRPVRLPTKSLYAMGRHSACGLRWAVTSKPSEHALRAELKVSLSRAFHELCGQGMRTLDWARNRCGAEEFAVD